MPDNIIERTAKLFEAGEYKDKGISVTESDIDALVAGFKEIPVKIEHSETPFDGFLGGCTKIWRKGADLMGSIGFSPEAWSLVDKADARKLSIGIKKDLSELTEVSLVKTPRVAGAAVFDDRIELSSGALVEIITFASWQGLTSEDIEDQAKEQIPTTKDQYCRIETVGEDFVIACVCDMNTMDDCDICTKYPFTITNKKVVLGDGVQVREQTTWIPVDTSMSAANSNTAEPSGGINMADNKNGAPTEGAVIFTDEQKAEIQKLVSGVVSETETKFSGDIAVLRAENEKLRKANTEKDVQFKLDALKRNGKLTPAMEPIARELLMAGDSTVTFNGEQTNYAALVEKMISALPTSVNFNELGETTGTAVEFSQEVVTQAAKLGVTPEQLAKFAGGN